MLDGHGDDTYRYKDVRINFSSNIPSHADLSELEAQLRSRLSVIRSYPEPSPRALETKIARSIGREPSDVLVTSGATEAIYLIAQAVACTFAHEGSGQTYTVVRPTFSEYDSACEMYGMTETEDGTLCWLCNPNNPTGTIHHETYIRELARRHRLLVIDQSYEDYTRTPLPQVGDLPNVLLLHSMTKKHCIPGLRLGYVTGPAPLIARLRQYVRPWAVNALAIEAGLWLLARPVPDNALWLSEAQRLRAALNRLPGIRAFDTETNFLLCTIAGRTAADLKETLVRRHGILIRDAANFRGLTPHHFRVAAQLPEENDELVRTLEKI